MTMTSNEDFEAAVARGTRFDIITDIEHGQKHSYGPSISVTEHSNWMRNYYGNITQTKGETLKGMIESRYKGMPQQPSGLSPYVQSIQLVDEGTVRVTVVTPWCD